MRQDCLSRQQSQFLRALSRNIARRFRGYSSADVCWVESMVKSFISMQFLTPPPEVDIVSQSSTRTPERHNAYGYICIPFVGKSKRYDALRRCVVSAADQSVMSEWQVARVMTLFIQAIADEVATGNPVRIPGLGMFTPWCWTAKTSGKQTMQPRFVPSRVFRLQVKHFCPVSDAMNKQSESYRRSHHPSSRKHDYGSTRAAMQHWRASIDRMFIPPSR